MKFYLKNKNKVSLNKKKIITTISQNKYEKKKPKGVAARGHCDPNHVDYRFVYNVCQNKHQPTVTTGGEGGGLMGKLRDAADL